MPANATFSSTVHTQVSLISTLWKPSASLCVLLSVYSGTLKPGMTYTKLIDADVNVGNITSIEFIWKEHMFGQSLNKLGAEMVKDISGKYDYE